MRVFFIRMHLYIKNHTMRSVGQHDYAYHCFYADKHFLCRIDPSPVLYRFHTKRRKKHKKRYSGHRYIVGIPDHLFYFYQIRKKRKLAHPEYKKQDHKNTGRHYPVTHFDIKYPPSYGKPPNDHQRTIRECRHVMRYKAPYGYHACNDPRRK